MSSDCRESANAAPPDVCPEPSAGRPMSWNVIVLVSGCMGGALWIAMLNAVTGVWSPAASVA